VAEDADGHELPKKTAAKKAAKKQPTRRDREPRSALAGL
jgi:hypothetical protein